MAVPCKGQHAKAGADQGIGEVNLKAWFITGLRPACKGCALWPQPDFLFEHDKKT